MATERKQNPKKERIAIGFGGSILAPPEPDPAFTRAVAENIMRWSRTRNLFIVVGGGYPARRSIAAARARGVTDEKKLDLLGIRATRANAQNLALALHRIRARVNLDIPRSTAQALDLAKKHDIVVMGGTEPGHSTDFVAAELAVNGQCARFVDATNVDFVYDRDPTKHKDAKPLVEMDFQQLLKVIDDLEWRAAGSPGVIDGPATKLLARNGMTTRVVNGKRLEELGRAVEGADFLGTVIAGPKVKV